MIKWKCLNLWLKISYLVIFRQEFRKTIIVIWNQHPRICLIAKSRKKTKMSKFGTKNALFGYFWTRILKNYSHIWNQHPRLCLISKFREKIKMPKFKTKNALFGYFWVRILKKLLSYLKSAYSNLSNCNISWKMKMP